MSTWAIGITSLSYIGLLFAIAWWADRHSHAIARSAWRPYIYAMSLAVYCTSWTFFGAVGTAASQGWNYLPIYLGPALLFLFGQRALRRLVEVAKRENITSIADFISSRYGKSPSVAAIVTILALIGVLPYIALQLKSIASSFEALRHGMQGAPDLSVDRFQVGLLSALVLGGFAIMFGARRYDATGLNQGMVVAIAMESVVKILALAAIAGLALFVLDDVDSARLAAGAEKFAVLFSPSALTPSFLSLTFLSAAAIICLPRQFHIAVVECLDAGDTRHARWLFPFYMLITIIVVAPITLAGLAVLPSGSSPDLFVLNLPVSQGSGALALLAFLGGISAATGMIIVETVALSTMISNHLLAPIMLRRGDASTEIAGEFGRRLLSVRRMTIIAVMLLSYLCYRNLGGGELLASIGLISFAAVAQFAPALVGAVAWPQGNSAGARAGLIGGMVIWGYTLLLPFLAGADAIEAAGLNDAFGGMISPSGLFGLNGMDSLTNGVLWSLGLNCALYIAFSLGTPVHLKDRLHALHFIPGGARKVAPATSVGDLFALAERFAGREAVERAQQTLSLRRHAALKPEDPIDRDTARSMEVLIAGVIGAPTARLIVTSALSRGSLDVVDVVRLLDEASQELQFNRELLHAIFENVSQGINVVDKDLRLVAWNSQYIKMFDYPPEFIRVGRPIADVFRFNAQRGEYGPGDLDQLVGAMMESLRSRQPKSSERMRPNGRVLKTLGNPMPGGAYVTSFTDITSEKAAEKALREANELLEERVAQRTALLSRANDDLVHEAERNRRLAEQLAIAKKAAEEADLGKTKFLAAASHDLLQPLNAARLFAAALGDLVVEGTPEQKRLARNVERSIVAADGLLKALLDISKLDAGGVTPRPARFRLGPLIDELASEFQPIAAARGLKLRWVTGPGWVESDRVLLRSILQNLLSNAVRYTEKGGILVGCRRRRDRLRIEVWDSGIGIPDSKLGDIFKEFRRLDTAQGAEKGVGLGLAIVDRIARLLDVSIDVRSKVGKGSTFSVELPEVAPGAEAAGAITTITAGDNPMLRGLKVLCVDNDQTILDGLSSLLSRWGCLPMLATNADDAIEWLDEGPIDVALVDHNLDAETGLDVLSAIRQRQKSRFTGILITADSSPALAEEARRLGYAFLTKPMDPAELKAHLSGTIRTIAAD